MLPYFPFKEDTFKLTMGIQALRGSLIEVDKASYAAEMKLKDELLNDANEHYFQAMPETEPLQWEAIELLLPHMAHHYPHYFTLTITGTDWTWKNALLGQETRFVFGERLSLPLPPLDWLGRQVQEDLLLLKSTKTGGCHWWPGNSVSPTRGASQTHWATLFLISIMLSPNSRNS